MDQAALRPKQTGPAGLIGRTRHPRFLALLFAVPFIFGSFVALWRGRHWFDDFEAVSCAGQALNAKLPLYISHFACFKMSPTIYVYPPAMARFFAAVEAHLGLTFEIFAYAAVFCVVVYNVWRLLIEPDRTINARAPFMVEITGSTLPSGNISIILHGLIFLCGRWFLAMPVLLVPLVAGAAILKPTFAVYLALFLFLKRPAPQRVALMAAGGVLIAWYFIVLYVGDRTEFVNWHATAQLFGIVVARGNGILGMPVIGSISDTIILAGCYGIFAAVILSSGLILSEFCVESAVDRLMLGISVCLLLYPRPMGYDLLTMPFGLGVAVSCFRQVGRFEGRHLAIVLRVLCPILMLIGGRAGELLFFELACVLLVVLAGAAVAMNLRRGNGLMGLRFVGPVVIFGRGVA